MLLPILAFTAIVVFLIYSTKGKSLRQHAGEETPEHFLTAAEKEIRQKVDLHYGRRDFSANSSYVEFSFNAPFGEMFNIEWMESNPDINGWELFEILEILNIPCNSELIFDKYEENGNSVEVFHSINDELVFAYFDLRRDPADQNRMFFFGLSCKREEENIVHEKLLNIYRKLYTSSAFSFDIHNHVLYNKTFRSYFYFYENDYNESKAQLNHHNL